MAWIAASLVMLRSTHNSSACLAISGNSSLIHSPLSPCCLVFHGDFRHGPLLSNCVASIFTGNGLPCSSASLGLGSNVSMWLRPPSMYSQMTRFALALWCGLASASMVPRANPPTPIAACCRKSLRSLCISEPLAGYLAFLLFCIRSSDAVATRAVMASGWPVVMSLMMLMASSV